MDDPDRSNRSSQKEMSRVPFSCQREKEKTSRCRRSTVQKPEGYYYYLLVLYTVQSTEIQKPSRAIERRRTATTELSLPCLAPSTYIDCCAFHSCLQGGVEEGEILEKGLPTSFYCTLTGWLDRADIHHRRAFSIAICRTEPNT